MPVSCARCGAANPDGNLYCQNCGTQLTPASGGVAIAAPPNPLSGPPPGVAAPAYRPGGYQSPYYFPAGPTAPVHRTPWGLIVGLMLGAIVLLGAVGTAVAFLGSHSIASTAPTTDVTTQLPSPTPGLIPSPVASPVSTTGSTETNAGVVVPVPPGWTVDSKDSETIVLTDPNTSGTVSVSSGGSNPAASAQDNKNTIDSYFKSTYPDAHNCPNTGVANSSFNGVNGLQWTVCFTLTASGHSMAAAAWIFAGANSSGNVYYVVMVATRQDNLQNYLNVAKPVLQGVHWKLS